MAKIGKRTESVDAHVLERVQLHGPGWVFTPADFADLGGRTAVATALKRHKAEGVIRLLGRGLYDVPQQHDLLGTLWPPIEAVEKALERKDGLRLQPSGAWSAKLLGLSEQVPAKVMFLTDGATRTVIVWPTQITLKRTTPRNMTAAGRLSGLVIQAFRNLGAPHITPERIARLRKNLPAPERAELLKDLSLAPEWMHIYFHQLAKP